jgi:hypothetical protein
LSLENIGTIVALAAFRRSLSVAVGVWVSKPICQSGLCCSDRCAFRSNLPPAGVLTLVKSRIMSDL